MFNRRSSTSRIGENVNISDLMTGVGRQPIGAETTPQVEQPKVNIRDLIDVAGPQVEQPKVNIRDLIDIARPPRDLDIFFPPGGIIQPPPPPPADPDIPRFSGPQTTTRLVTYAIETLENLPRDPLQSALNFIQAKPQHVQPGELLEDLRQRTSFDEVLQEKAEGWKPVTRRVFAEVFAMPADNLVVMDAIVSIALLNRPDLEEVLRRENAAPASLQDLLENRRIVWQYPPPGTPLTPPYVIVVAVESVDTGPAVDIVQRILSSLVTTPSGYRLPRGAAQKLG
jgi:hypothetical protein